MAAAVVLGDTGVDGQTGEPVSRETFRTGAAHLFFFLRTFGHFSTTTVPDAAHLGHCRDRLSQSSYSF